MDYIDPNLARMDSPPPQGPFYTSANTITITILTGVAAVLNVVPFHILYAAKQMPACTMIAVTILVLFFNFVNAILWHDDDITKWWNGNGLCDIEVLLKAVLSTLCASSTACLTYNLSQAVDVDNNPRLFESAAMRRRRMIGEFLFCFGIPFIQLITHYFIQAGRYAVITVYGCVDVVDNSWVTIFLFAIWPLVFYLICCYYAALVMIRLRRHRGNLSSTLSSSGSSFTARRFLKLFFLCMLFFILQLPAALAFFYFNVRNSLPLQSYSFTRIHDPSIWPIVIFFTTPDYPLLQYYGWPPFILGLGVFLFYGMNNEAIDQYRRFAVFCKLGKVWPSLTQPREPRRRVNDSRSSWTSHFDVLGKAVRYFDGVRKHSQSSTVTGSELDQSHKDPMTLTNVTSASTYPITPTSSCTPLQYHISWPINHSTATLAPTTLTPAPPPLSGFRTCIQIPFPIPLFHKKSPHSTPQHHHHQHHHSNSTATGDDAFVLQQAIQTTISTGNPSSFTAGANSGEVEEEAPKRCTRAYRERERREIQREGERDRESGGALSVRIEQSLDQSSSH